jgi:hypothetical protein
MVPAPTKIWGGKFAAVPDRQRRIYTFHFLLNRYFFSGIGSPQSGPVTSSVTGWRAHSGIEVSATANWLLIQLLTNS